MNMKVFFQGALLVLTGMVMTSMLYAQDSEVKWANVSDPVYRLAYPEKWELNKTSDIGINLMALAPLEKEGDKFRENLTIVIQELEPNQTGESLGRNSISEIVELLDDSELVESKFVTNGDKSYYRGVYLGEQYGMHLRFEQRYFSKGNLAYILVLTCETASYDRYEADFERMFESFAFVK